MTTIKILSYKFIRAVVTLLGGVLIVFLLMHYIPENPWNNNSASPRLLFNMQSDPIFQREMSRRFGLDLPLWQQFTHYLVGNFESDGSFMCGAVCGNLGPSISQRGRFVQDVIFKPPKGQSGWQSRFGYSIRLVLFSSFFVIGLGIPSGMVLGLKPGLRISRFILLILTTITSIPNFILGLMGMIVFALWLKFINVVPNWDKPTDWIMPAIILAAIPMANLARVVRTALMRISGEDYIRTARAKGLTKVRILLAHVLLNAMPPILMYFSSVTLEMFTGLFVIEALFGFPGIGREYWDAVLELNYPMVLGLTLIYGCGIVLVNFGIEVACYLLDPRLQSDPLGVAM